MQLQAGRSLYTIYKMPIEILSSDCRMRDHRGPPRDDASMLLSSLDP